MLSPRTMHTVFHDETTAREACKNFVAACDTCCKSTTETGAQQDAALMGALAERLRSAIIDHVLASVNSERPVILPFLPQTVCQDLPPTPTLADCDFPAHGDMEEA